MYKRNSLFFLPLTALLLIVPATCQADVPTPPTAPPPPGGYCGTIYGELSANLQAFNLVLSVPPLWKPVPGGPTLFGANLQQADSNTGPALSGPNYMPGVQKQLLELKATGIKAVMVQVGFPVLYEPFYGSQTAVQPYLNFYSQVAQAGRSAGLKLIVENDALPSADINTGWTNLISFYSTFSWSQYKAARASMAATVAQTMQPDYLVLAEEPDGEAKQTGQTNMNTAVDAAQLISGEISAVRALNLPGIKLGAGFGNWLAATPPNGLLDYINAYVALPLDYIDFHIYPINNEAQAILIDNALVIASVSAAAGKPVAISDAWDWKMENSEFGVLNGQNFRARDPFSFWGPLDAEFLKTLQSLAKYTNMLYVAPEGPDYLFTYQTYGGTTANGGAANCTCTTASCSDYNIVHTETSQSSNANAAAQFSATGFSYASDLVSPADNTPPSTPANLTGTPSYTQVNLSWNASSDNVGVAGYNLYRCSPSSQGQSCTGAWIANVTATTYVDSGLAENVPYNYQVQAFDLANNKSPVSQTLSVLTFRSPPNAPSNMVATVISAKQVNLTWTPPQSGSGLSQYLVYAGSSSTALQQIATRAAGATSYNDMSLSPSTSYFFAVAAVESGVTSPKSPVAFAITDPAPNAPTSVTASATGNTTIALTWAENMVHGGLPVSSYQILRGTAPGSLTLLTTVLNTNYNDKSVAPGKTYYYKIVAVDSGHDLSARSSEVSATTP